ncbi:acyltransferase family protein [Microbacterium sp.]|uniref:acyltransferase family protein n=1 Tax=Microbacterium sp. TaxID=51671 RepID=UPI0037CBCCB8
MQGLRAIAVGLVLLYHAGVAPFTGGYVGVDVFFVISGFLISSHLLDSIDRTGRVGFAQFYARRARRILPASFTVAILTAVALVLFAPPLTLTRMLEDAVATILYVPNVRFAIQDTDYLADHAPSAYQHYWSLGVEEQFYLIWPLLLLAIVLLARRRRAVVGLLVTLVAAGSFVACVLVTQVQQPMAFFLLPMRAWELLAGALVGIVLLRANPRMPGWVAAAGGWLGLGAVLAAGILFDDATAFPGAAAALPVVGTAAVIFFGTSSPRGGPGRLLSLRPMQYVGLISYSLYLVHWPLLVVPALAVGDELLGSVWMRVLLGIVVAVPVAGALYRFVEDPVRRARILTARPPRTTLLATGAATLVIALAVGLTAAWSAVRPILGPGGAEVAPAEPVAPPPISAAVPENLTPSLRSVADDIPDLYPDGCHHDTVQTRVQECVYGDEEADLEVAIFGDSHSAQWLPALQSLSASTLPMSIRTYTKSSCPAVDVAVLVRNVPYTSCDSWRSAVLEHLVSDPPDLVLISSYADYPLADTPTADRLDAWGTGLQDTVGALAAAGIEVVVIADTPRFPTAPADCVSVHLADADVCAGVRAEVLSPDQATVERAATEAAGGRFVDLTPYLCDAQLCPVVVFDLLVYRDVNHLTTAFVRYLAPALEPELISASPGR